MQSSFWLYPKGINHRRESCWVFCCVLSNNRCSSCYQCLRFLISQNCLLYNICWPSRLINLHNYWLQQKLVLAYYFGDVVLTTSGTASMINHYRAGWLWEWYFNCTRQMANRWVYIKARSKFRSSPHTQPPNKRRMAIFVFINLVLCVFRDCFSA